MYNIRLRVYFIRLFKIKNYAFAFSKIAYIAYSRWQQFLSFYFNEHHSIFLAFTTLYGAIHYYYNKFYCRR